MTIPDFNTFGKDPKSRIYSVSEITLEIKSLLEERFPFVWIVGEISNFRVPVSGHFYFTLKDDASQITAVMFRGQNRKLGFMPEDGMQVVGLGRISLYEPRGTYQMLFEYLEPQGIGALQIAFEQLKARLAAEGLFDAVHKRPIPFLPGKITLLTSPTGAVVHDMLTIIQRRFPNVCIDIIPIRVQGDDSVSDIVAGIELMQLRGDSDVAILARGGGSLEDLYPFNSEAVARAIFAADIPIISAVGHETDFTIADFVADLRVPTPSAAAELVVPVKNELIRQCRGLTLDLLHRMVVYRNRLCSNVAELSRRLVHPKKKLQDTALRIDDHTSRVIRATTVEVSKKRDTLKWIKQRLYTENPVKYINIYKSKNDNIYYNLFLFIGIIIERHHQCLGTLMAKLAALSPMAILARGYSITRTTPNGIVVRNSNTVDENQDLEIMLAKGNLKVRVLQSIPPED